MSHDVYKVIFFKTLQFLLDCLHNYKLLPQDFADSLASHLSATLVILLFLLTMARMFFMATMECLTPPEWPEAWEKAAEAFCFTDGTYALPYNTTNVTDGSEWSHRLQQGYYYWIPYILVGQAVILKAPDFFWHFLCDLHPKQPAETLKAFAFLIGSEEIAEKGDEKEMLRLTNCVQRQKWTERLAEHLMSRNELVNFDTWHLFALFLVFKALRLAAVLLSLVYLQTVFGLDSALFGLRMARNSLQAVPWERTDLFPRWAFCDVHVKLLGSWNTRVMQCALPINMLLEKLLLFLWFWLVFCALVLVLSAAAWSLKMLPSRRREFAMVFLCIGESFRLDSENDQARLERKRALAKDFSATDRTFMLRLVEERLGLAAAYLAMDCIVDMSDNIH